MFWKAFFKTFACVKFLFQFCRGFFLEFREGISKLESFNLILNCFAKELIKSRLARCFPCHPLIFENTLTLFICKPRATGCFNN